MSIRTIVTIISLVIASFDAFAGTAIALANRIRIWDGPYAIPDSGYMIGNSPSLGTIKTLKYSLATENTLKYLNIASNTGGLNMSSKVLTAFSYNNNLYERLSEIGIPSGECVAFAKAMTGVGGTSSWYKGGSLMNYIVWNGAGYVLNPASPSILQPGTMIAHFQGLARYPQSLPYGHVAIFLSWSKNNQGWIDGINVVDQNFVWTIDGIAGSQGTIQKHKIPLSGSTTATYNANQYHIVDVRP